MEDLAVYVALLFPLSNRFHSRACAAPRRAPLSTAAVGRIPSPGG